MANEEHLKILKQGVEVWNRWRKDYPDIIPDLEGASITRTYLSRVDLHQANISQAGFSGAHLYEANLSRADISKANFNGAFLHTADLSGANLSGADLSLTNLIYANLSEADLSGANLEGALIARADMSKTNLTGCRVYAISAWDLHLEGSSQRNLVITPMDQPDQPTITVDNLEVAQFIYLLLNNEKIRNVIDTITSKAVLILGRFTEERKVILDALKETLRKRDYLPILFDFNKPASRDLTETISTLAHMSRFIIADITEPRSIPQELQAIVPDLAVPIQPLLLQGSSGEFAMFRDLKRKYHWVLATYEYSGLDELLSTLEEKVISPAEAKADELRKM